MNIFTYQILSLLLLPFAFFRLLLRAFKQRQYFYYWGERLGFYPKYLKNILKDKNKNIIKDGKVSDFTIRYQIIKDLPFKELRNIIDAGKNDIKKGILIAFSVLDGKIGVSVGVTKNLTEKFDAVELVKEAASVLGGKGGGGRKDFAQAGGVNENKIEEAFKSVLKKIN